jgi:Peptidase propeptide and YPEB domain
MRFINQLSIAIVVLALNVFCSAAPRQKPHLSMEQAEKIALGRQSGHIRSSALEREHGRLIYSFDIERDETVHEVNVDANTGKILEDKVESASVEARERRQEKKAGKHTSPMPW